MGLRGSPAPLPLLLLALLLPAGRAQLEFNKSGNVVRTACDKSFWLPCYVTNLQKHNTAAMYVEWKLNGQRIYAFDGSSSDTRTTPDFSSASLNLAAVPQGDTSLTLADASQAVEGQYTCEVTEESRTGASSFTLTYGSRWQMFQLPQAVPIIVFLCLAVVGFWTHFGITRTSFYKYKLPKLAVALCLVFGIILTILAIVGLSLLFTNDFTAAARAGLGLAVILTMGLIVVLQYFLRPSDGALWSVLALKIVGFVIIIAGFIYFLLSTCPPTKAALLLSGIVIVTAFVYVDLVYSAIKVRAKESTGDVI